jgi:hypothetical protein
MASAIWAAPRRVPVRAGDGWWQSPCRRGGYGARAGLGGSGQRLAAVRCRVFLKQDHVGPGRQGRPGADADGLTRARRPGERMARSAFADTVHGPGMSAAQGIAVHRRKGGGGWVLGQQGRCQIVAQRIRRWRCVRPRAAPARSGGPAPLPSGRGGWRGVVMGQVQSPDLPPRLAIRRTASMTMPLSTALAMS